MGAPSDAIDVAIHPIRGTGLQYHPHCTCLSFRTPIIGIPDTEYTSIIMPERGN